MLPALYMEQAQLCDSDHGVPRHVIFQDTQVGPTLRPISQLFQGQTDLKTMPEIRILTLQNNSHKSTNHQPCHRILWKSHHLEIMLENHSFSICKKKRIAWRPIGPQSSVDIFHHLPIIGSQLHCPSLSPVVHLRTRTWTDTRSSSGIAEIPATTGQIRWFNQKKIDRKTRIIMINKGMILIRKHLMGENAETWRHTSTQASPGVQAS